MFDSLTPQKFNKPKVQQKWQMRLTNSLEELKNILLLQEFISRVSHRWAKANPVLLRREKNVGGE